MHLSGTKGAWFCRFLAHNSLKLGQLEKSWGIFCSSVWPLSTLQILAKSPQGSPRNSRSREVFFYGHQRCPYIRLSGPTTPLFGQNLGRGSLKWHWSGKKFGGYFEGLDDLYAPCEFQQNHPMVFGKFATARSFFFFSFFFFSLVCHAILLP